MEYRELLRRFWQKVERTDWCWNWTGGLDDHGYGRIKIAGSAVKAHRFAYELLHGPLPSEVLVLHRCDNRRCVRPDHLFEGDQLANVEDAKAKGRCRGNAGLGEPKRLGPWQGRGYGKLSPEQVDDIRTRYATGKVLQRELAAEFGVSPAYICELLQGRYRVEVDSL